MIMEERINVAELLKDCPKGMELDCILFDNIYFDTVGHNTIKCYIKNKGYRTYISFDFYGGLIYPISTKCVIFPKGKTTWDGFQMPFKDGDIVSNNNGSWIGITLGGKKFSFIPTYCVIKSNDTFEAYFDRKEKWSFDRLATKEEKQKLFDAIKANGYKWNAETKTLEKLVEPKFKVGDRVRNKNYKDYIYDIHDIIDKGYRAKEINADSLIIILFGSQEDNYELVPNKFDINTLVPFESRVLVRDSTTGTWYPEFFGGLYDSNDYPYMVLGGNRWKYCVPYKGNEHLLKTNNDPDDYYKTWE